MPVFESYNFQELVLVSTQTLLCVGGRIRHPVATPLLIRHQLWQSVKQTMVVVVVLSLLAAAVFILAAIIALRLAIAVIANLYVAKNDLIGCTQNRFEASGRLLTCPEFPCVPLRSECTRPIHTTH